MNLALFPLVLNCWNIIFHLLLWCNKIITDKKLSAQKQGLVQELQFYMYSALLELTSHYASIGLTCIITLE